MSSPRLDEDPFCFDFTGEFLAEFVFFTAGGIVTTTGGPGEDDGDVEGRCLVLEPTATNSTMPPLHSLLKVTWGIHVIAARSVGLTTSIAKRIVEKIPVGIVNF